MRRFRLCVPLLLCIYSMLALSACDGTGGDDPVDDTSTGDDTSAPDTATEDTGSGEDTSAADTGAGDTTEPDTSAADVGDTTGGDTTEPADVADMADDGFPIGPNGPTWYEHVQPLVYENCVGCHQAGGIAPFSLETYEGAAPMAEAMAGMTGARLMPPWLADNSGECQTFQHARWLDQSQIDLIAQWAATGAQEGDPANAHAVFPEPELLTDASVTVQPTEPYTPDDAASDDYRCFIVDPQTTTDKFLTAFQVNPGEPEIVHHMILYTVNDADSLAEAVARDDADPGIGYRCFGGPRISSSFFLAAWAPGTRVIDYPAGTGVRVKANLPLIMQVHYNLAAGTRPDQTSVDLKFADSVPKEAYLVPIPHGDIELTPGQAEEVEVLEADNPIPVNIKLRGVMPHMHTLGRKLKLEFIDNDGTTCALNVPRWDFNWQYSYFYDTPLTVESNSTLRLSCTYDTRSRTETVYWGDGTADEMCLVIGYATFN